MNLLKKHRPLTWILKNPKHKPKWTKNPTTHQPVEKEVAEGEEDVAVEEAVLIRISIEEEENQGGTVQANNQIKFRVLQKRADKNRSELFENFLSAFCARIINLNK
jgi:hypothetical protein